MPFLSETYLSIRIALYVRPLQFLLALLLVLFALLLTEYRTPV